MLLAIVKNFVLDGGLINLLSTGDSTDNIRQIIFNVLMLKYDKYKENVLRLFNRYLWISLCKLDTAEKSVLWEKVL